MNICIIPARGGSKRIPKKNIKNFNGKPIIAYSIEAAKRANLFNKIIVSTEDIEIRRIARIYGAEVPFTRPLNIADDYTGTIDVISHALKWCLDQGWQVSYVCCLYATAPFVSTQDLKKTLNVIQTGHWDYTFTICEYPAPIFRSFKLNDNCSVEMFFPENFTKRSQDLPTAFHDTGQFYWGKIESWLNNVPIFDKNSYALAIPRWRVQDIDTLDDWKRAEQMHKIMNNTKNYI